MDAKAICRACIQMRHHNHSLNEGTILNKALLMGGQTTTTFCKELLSCSARVHILLLPACKLVLGYVSSAAFCTILLGCFLLGLWGGFLIFP